RNPVERLRHAKETFEHLAFRKITAHLLLGEREFPCLELLCSIGTVPWLEIGDAELGRGERLELRVVARGIRFGAAREIAQEDEHVVDALGHLGDERESREIRITQELR